MKIKMDARPLPYEFPAHLKHERFTSKDVLTKYPDIKLVVDLTFTTRYYNGEKEFESNNVKYVKIKCRGHVVPDESNFQMFAESVNQFLKNNPQDYLIGIHCTHGVNRTGYFIVRYMIEYLGYAPQKALNGFLKSRGRAIERTNYIADLRRRKKLNEEPPKF